MSDYDLFISYRVKTDAENAKILFAGFRADQTKNMKVFLDNRELKLGNDWKMQFLAALKKSRAGVPIISNRFIEALNVEEGKEDNVLSEWDTMIDCCQLIIPVFVHDDTGPLDFEKADLAMKSVRAKDCKRTANELWECFKTKQGRNVDLRDSNQVELFVLKVRDQMPKLPFLELLIRLFSGSPLFNPSNQIPIAPSDQTNTTVPSNQPPTATSADQTTPAIISSTAVPSKIPDTTPIPIPTTSLANPRPMQFNLYAKDDPKIFIECTKLFGEIIKILENSNICNLKGLGGSGKTFVANKLAFLMLAKGYIIAKFTADNEANLTRDFADYLTRLFKVEKLEVTGGKVGDYLQLLNNSHHNTSKQFIILDNVKSCDDIAEFEHCDNPNIKFLITSRTFITTPVINKDFYSEEACIEYLKKETNRGFTDEHCKSIFDITNGFPLRLTIAARTLRDPTERLNDYLADVRKKKDSMNFDFNPEKDASDDVDELFPEVSLSIDKLTGKVACGHEFLALLAKLEPDLIVEKYLVESLKDYSSGKRASVKGGIPDNSQISPWKIDQSDKQMFDFALDATNIENSRRHALKLGIIEYASTQSNLENVTRAITAFKIHRCVQAEICDRVKKLQTLEAAVVEIAKLYDKRTKSYNTLCEELKAQNVDDAVILLQKWSTCSLNGKTFGILNLKKFYYLNF
ncbi:hypothetical protein HK098_006946 [Nowakowskiella sp. JEL0407]|nr:hypothetical protein HK098_006946 [Nowakowskiella sp. JEL0407]